MILFILEVLFKHKYRIVLGGALATLAASWVVLSQTDIYEARATLLVKLGREYLYVPEIGDSTAKAPNELSELVNAEMQILNSRDLREHVIKQIGIETIYPGLSADYPGGSAEPEAMIAAQAIFEDGVAISAIPNSHVVNIRFRHADPELAARVTSLLVDAYQAKRVHIFGRLEAQFLRQQLGTAKDALSKAQVALDDFKRANNLYSFDEQFRILLTEQRDLAELLQNLDRRGEVLEQKVKLLGQDLSTLPQTVTAYADTQRNPAVDTAHSRQLELQLKQQEITRMYGERHPDALRAKSELAVVEQFLRRNGPTIPGSVRTAQNPLYADLEAQLVTTRTELSSLRVERAKVERQLVESKDRLDRRSSSEAGLRSLEQALENQQTAYSTYLAKVREAELIEALDRDKQTNVRVIEAAATPSDPIGVSEDTRLVFALAAGLLLTVASALAVEWFKPTFMLPDLVERRLGLPVLASVQFAKGRAAGPRALIDQA